MKETMGRTTHRRLYVKPQLEQVELIAEEAVLTACKAGQFNVPGVCGHSLCVWVFSLCSTQGS